MSDCYHGLLERTADLRNVEIKHMLTLSAANYTRPEYEGHFRHNGLLLGSNVRAAVAQGRAGPYAGVSE
jgi:hypothetical protein